MSSTQCVIGFISNEGPSVEFISDENSMEVKRDSHGVASAIYVVAPDEKVLGVVDLADRTSEELKTLNLEGVRVLTSQNIEGYLPAYDVLTKAFEEYGSTLAAEAMITYRNERLQASVFRGNPSDDFKKAVGDMKVHLSQALSIAQHGSRPFASLAKKIAPLCTSGTSKNSSMGAAIFGAYWRRPELHRRYREKG